MGPFNDPWIAQMDRIISKTRQITTQSTHDDDQYKKENHFEIQSELHGL